MERKIEAYFDRLAEAHQPPTVAGLAYELDYDSRAALLADSRILTGRGSANAKVLRRALLWIEACAEACLYGSYNAGAKFGLEHNFEGWSVPLDKQLPSEITVELVD